MVHVHGAVPIWYAQMNCFFFLFLAEGCSAINKNIKFQRKIFELFSSRSVCQFKIPLLIITLKLKHFIPNVKWFFMHLLGEFRDSSDKICCTHWCVSTESVNYFALLLFLSILMDLHVLSEREIHYSIVAKTSWRLKISLTRLGLVPRKNNRDQTTAIKTKNTCIHV